MLPLSASQREALEEATQMYELAVAATPAAVRHLHARGIDRATASTFLPGVETPDWYERFWRKTERSGDCILWTGALDEGGYGRFNIDGRSMRAHRIAFTLAHGPIPEGYVIDHTCRVRRCVHHLEAVTNAENVRRGRLAASNHKRGEAQTHCKAGGHPLSGENLKVNVNGRRECRECRRLRTAERSAA